MRLTYTEESMIAMIDLWSMHQPDLLRRYVGEFGQRKFRTRISSDPTRSGRLFLLNTANNFVTTTDP
jgi:hypothetical protein